MVAAAAAATAAAVVVVVVVLVVVVLLLLLLRGLLLGRRHATRNDAGRAGAACAKGMGASRATRPRQFSKPGLMPTAALYHVTSARRRLLFAYLAKRRAGCGRLLLSPQLCVS